MEKDKEKVLCFIKADRSMKDSGMQMSEKDMGIKNL